MGLFDDWVFNDSSSGSTDSWFDNSEYTWGSSYLAAPTDSSNWLSESYNPGGNMWDSLYSKSSLDLDGGSSWLDKGGALLGKAGKFLGSEKGMGFLGGMGNAGLSYLSSDKLLTTQQKYALENMAKQNEYAMAMLRLKDEIADGNRSGSGGGDGGGSNDAGIKALADKYPSDPNFKR